MPGLLRGIARTVAIAGTATAVANGVSRRQRGRWATQDQQAYAQPGQTSAIAPAPPDDMEVRLAQLKDLAELESSGS